MTPGPISQRVVAAKLDLLHDMLRGVGSLPLSSFDEFTADPRMVAAAESYLRRALEALLDLGRHLLAKGYGEVVPEYAALGPALAARGLVSAETADRLRRMGGYRNRLVHGYDEVSSAELYRILTGNLVEITVAADEIRDWLAAHPDRIDASL